MLVNLNVKVDLLDLSIKEARILSYGLSALIDNMDNCYGEATEEEVRKLWEKIASFEKQAYELGLF